MEHVRKVQIHYIPSGQTCYGNQCVTNCNNHGDCDTSEFCFSGHCEDRRTTGSQCQDTRQCTVIVICYGHGECDTCDDAGYGDWTADGSCVSGGWQVDASTIKHGSTSSTKYLTEADAQNACTNGCQGITHWYVKVADGNCGSTYAALTVSSLCGGQRSGNAGNIRHM